MDKEVSIKNLVTRESLLALAGEKFFARGQDYYDRDFVELVFYAEDCVIAKVWGSYPYLVDLGIDENGLSYDCTCPAMDDFGVYKHIVATGLAVINAQAESQSTWSTKLQALCVVKCCAFLAPIAYHPTVPFLFRKKAMK